jgi:hypothetical protein
VPDGYNAREVLGVSIAEMATGLRVACGDTKPDLMLVRFLGPKRLLLIRETDRALYELELAPFTQRRLANERDANDEYSLT